MEEPNKLQVILMKIWPSIYRAINGTISFLLRLTVDGIKRAFSQIKGMS